MNDLVPKYSFRQDGDGWEVVCQFAMGGIYFSGHVSIDNDDPSIVRSCNVERHGAITRVTVALTIPVERMEVTKDSPWILCKVFTKRNGDANVKLLDVDFGVALE